MRTKLLFIVFSFCALAFNAQVWKWATHGGGTYSDKAQAIDVDENGNSYFCGFYNVGQPADITPSFGPFQPSANWGKEGFIAKVDKNGNFVWVKEAIGGYDERVLGIHVDKLNGFVYATGTTWGWGPNSNDLAFGTCSTNAAYGEHDQIFLGKFDLNGNCQWLVEAGGESDDHGFDITTDKWGSVYLTGFFSDAGWNGSPAVFGSFSVTAPMGDSLAFVAKLSPGGVFQWVRTFGGCDAERDNRIECDSAGNVYIVGGFYGTKTFGSSTLNAADHDIFVVKYDKNGNFIWVRQAGGLLDDRANCIAIDPAQQIYITGEFRDHAIFGLDTLNNNGGPNGRDIFVSKITTAGVWEWAKKAGSDAGGERGNSICTNNKGNIFVTGTFADTAKFGGNITLLSSPISTLDIFVAAIDSLGKWRWAVKAGSALEDKGNGIACDDSCYIYTAGWFEQTATFGSVNVTAYASKDAYAAKLKTTCFTYTEVTTGYDWIEPGQFTGLAFPNPAKDHLRIKINAENLNLPNINIKFMDMLGREIIVEQELGNEMLFNVSALEPGVYFVVISDEANSARIKFIKK